MTKQEYESIKKSIENQPTISLAVFQWELLKALWDLTRAIKGELDD